MTNEGGPYEFSSEVEDPSNDRSNVMKPNKFFRKKMTCHSLARQNASFNATAPKRSAEQPFIVEKPAERFISAAARKHYDDTSPNDSISSLVQQAKGVIQRGDNMNQETHDVLINLTTALTAAHEKIRLLTYVLVVIISFSDLTKA